MNKRDSSTMNEENSTGQPTASSLTEMLNEILPSNFNENAKGDSDSIVKRFLSLDEFLSHPVLNKVTCSDPGFPDTVMITSTELLNSITEQLTQEEFESFLTTNEVTRKNSSLNIKFYGQMVYDLMSILILTSYASKFTDKPDVLNLIGIIVNFIPHHKHLSNYALKELRKMIQSDTETNISSQTIKNSLAAFISKNFKRQKITVDIIPVEDASLEAWFTTRHIQLYEDVVKPFMDIGWFFANISSTDKIGFSQITRSNIKTKDDGSHASLKLSMVKPIMVKVTRKIIKQGYKLIDLPVSVSANIIDTISKDVRFYDSNGLNIKLDYFDGVNICNPQSALVYNLYSVGTMYPHHDSTVNWNVDILDSNIDVYMMFNSIHLVYGDDTNKISLKLYPVAFNSSIQSISKIMMVSIPRVNKEEDLEE